MMLFWNRNVWSETGSTKTVKRNWKNLIVIPNKLIIEGHTDSRPYSNDGNGYTNFELSTDRSNSARRILVSGGLDADRIDEVRGYADTKLSDKNDPFNLVNRRISVIIKFATEEPKWKINYSWRW